jgi:transcriptional regulator with XRE-family HTH domain
MWWPYVLSVASDETYQTPAGALSVGMEAIDCAMQVGEPVGMKRPSVYPYKITEPPGATVYRLRAEKEWSQRELADRCQCDWTSISRLENNQSWSRDLLERVAKAFRISVVDLFAPPELAQIYILSEPRRKAVLSMLSDAVAAQKAEDQAPRS